MSIQKTFLSLFRLGLLVVFSLCLSVSGISPAQAQAKGQAPGDSGFGLGLVLGAPTAITGKYYLNREQAVDVGLAYDFDDSFTLYGDYLKHWPRAFASQREAFLRQLVPYIGIGGLFHNSKDPYRNRDNPRSGESVTNLIVRVPIGIEWLTPSVPLGVFLELVPGIYIAPEVAASFMGGIGLRYYF